MKLNLRDLGRKLTAGRQPNAELTAVARAAICGALAAGQSIRAVATAFSVSVATVAKSLELLEAPAPFESKPRAGRPQKLSRAEKRYIITLFKRNRRIAKSALCEAVGAHVSYDTIRRCLRAYKMRKWKAMKRIPLSKEVAIARY